MKEHNKTGHIYIGYQGIGKTCTVNECAGFIDLESSNFKYENGERPDQWGQLYAKTALDLASQGYCVFTSSHEAVRKEISRFQKEFYPKIEVSVIYPVIELKDEWIERLQKRFEQNPVLKNKLALLNAKERYVENIEEIKCHAQIYDFDIIEINSTNYKLIDVIKSHSKI